MGYTHYWNRTPGTEPKEAYGRLLLDSKAIIEQAAADGIGITGWSGDIDGPDFEEAQLNEGMIRLNGVGAESHETFYWPADPTPDPEDYQRPRSDGSVFTFCKTARKPYDAVVGAILCRAKVHYGDTISISSDGSMDWDERADYGTWAQPRELYAKVFGEQPVAPFPVEEMA